VEGATTSGTGNGVFGTGPETGVYGQATGGALSSVGVEGTISGGDVGFGVYGYSPYIGVTGLDSSATYGVGVYGLFNTQSTQGQNLGVAGGVWGDTGVVGYTAVNGTADNGYAAGFYNNSATRTTMYVHNASSGGTGDVLEAEGQSGICSINGSGDVACTGKVASVVSTEAGQRKVSLYSTQSAENWFEDAGSAQLSRGSATVILDPSFAQTVNTGVEYHVFLTPNGDCKGLYVSQKSAGSFEVHELGGGASSVSFDYRIMAKRVGYENKRLEDVTELYEKMQ
jgi:hypothetical protein